MHWHHSPRVLALGPTLTAQNGFTDKVNQSKRHQSKRMTARQKLLSITRMQLRHHEKPRVQGLQ